MAHHSRAPHLGVDPETRRYLNEIARVPARDAAELEDLDPAALRITPPRGLSVKPLRAHDLQLMGPGGVIRARLHRPRASAPRSGLLLYLHGGGFVSGVLEGADSVCERIVAGAGCHVLAIDYRLAPEAPFPAAVEDCLHALRWARDSARWGAWDERRLAVGGESAGGNLAAVCAQQWRDRESPPLCLQLLICPLTDFRHRRWRSRERFEDAPVLSTRTLRWFEEHYLRSESDRADPRASPLAARDLRGLPPAHVVTADLDPLHDEGVAYAEALAGAGVEVTRASYPTVHGFVGLHESLSLGRVALDGCTHAVARAMAREVGAR